ncbi:MAG TPA: SET domain-containing protein [Allosphingosinicella sp.]|uniref:SET domain-containing protein n=1 Tax=Allosphingosinicella sp. TaxID=2823234 RepID=UPI002ED99A9C
MMLIPTYVAPSKIEGVGVFAAEDVSEGAQIWELAPSLDRLIHKDEVAGLPPPLQDFVERYSYPYPHDPDQLIVEIDNGRFMNHSEHPNTRFDDPDAGFTRRAIKAGEELTCNYAEFDPTFEILPGRLFVVAE